MVEFFVGVAVGAAFAPFWMMVWNWLQTFAPVKAVVDFFKNLFTAK